LQFDSNKLAAIIETAKSRSSNSPRWLRAIDRAAAALINGDLIVTTLHNGALVTSVRGTYRVNGKCECKAAQNNHGEYYHRAAARMVEMYEAAPEAMTKPAPRSPRITRSVETGRAGVKLAVTRCEEWMI
jgi:hypothetical protein